MERLDELIAVARTRVRADLHPLPFDPGGEEVQLSVRLPANLRAAVAQLAARREQSVTALVVELLEQAVQEANDPFAGLAADMVAHTRTLLREAVDSGAYARAAADVDRREAEWDPDPDDV